MCKKALYSCIDGMGRVLACLMLAMGGGFRLMLRRATSFDLLPSKKNAASTGRRTDKQRLVCERAHFRALMITWTEWQYIWC